MSEYSSDSLMKNINNIFSELSNSASYDFKFLKNKNSRFYNQLDLLFEDNSSVKNNLVLISNKVEKSKNMIHSYSQELDIDTLANKKAKLIKETLKYDDFIPGDVSKTQLLFENLYKDNVSIFREAYQKCWLDLYRHNDTENFIKFISISSDLDYEILQERADSLIIAGYAHIEPLVMESAIRAIEKWQQADHIHYLMNMRPSEIDWIESYKLEVIEDLQHIL
jgi:hypothetical protein